MGKEAGRGARSSWDGGREGVKYIVEMMERGKGKRKVITTVHGMMINYHTTNYVTFD